MLKHAVAPFGQLHRQAAASRMSMRRTFEYRHNVRVSAAAAHDRTSRRLELVVLDRQCKLPALRFPMLPLFQALRDESGNKTASFASGDPA